MPRITRKVDHDLGKEEVIARLKNAADRARSLSVFKEQWTGDTMEFSASVQGVKLSGKIQVSETTLDVEINLPLIAMPFSGWLDGMIQAALKMRRADSEEAAAPVPEGNSGMIDSGNGRETGPVILFLHIPKAAGTTLAEFIFDNCKTEREAAGSLPQPDLFKQGIYYCPFGFFKDAADLHPGQMKPILSHPALRAVAGHFSFGIHSMISRPVSYITLLRHPLERIMSLYSYLQARENLSMEAFLELNYNELDNDQTRRISGMEPEFGQCGRSHLERAKQHLSQYFSVAGVSERFDETLVLLKRRLGWTGNYFPGPRNVTPGQQKIGSLPDRLRDRIIEMNQLDMELHQYVCGLLDEAIAAEGAGFEKDLLDLRSMRQNNQA